MISNIGMEHLEDRRMLATIIVDNFADSLVSDGSISLREAIRAANNDSIADLTEGTQLGSGDDTIVLSAGTYTLSRGSGDDVAINGDLDIDSNITIQGNGATIDANSLDRVLHITGAGSLTLLDVKITGGNQYSGGGIFNQGDLSIYSSEISGNKACCRGWNFKPRQSKHL